MLLTTEQRSEFNSVFERGKRVLRLNGITIVTLMLAPDETLHRSLTVTKGKPRKYVLVHL